MAQVLALGLPAAAGIAPAIFTIAPAIAALGQTAADRLAPRWDTGVRGATGGGRGGTVVLAAGLGGSELALGLAVLVVVIAAGDEGPARAVTAGVRHTRGGRARLTTRRLTIGRHEVFTLGAIVVGEAAGGVPRVVVRHVAFELVLPVVGVVDGHALATRVDTEGLDEAARRGREASLATAAAAGGHRADRHARHQHLEGLVRGEVTPGDHELTLGVARRDGRRAAAGGSRRRRREHGFDTSCVRARHEERRDRQPHHCNRNSSRPDLGVLHGSLPPRLYDAHDMHVNEVQELSYELRLPASRCDHRRTTSARRAWSIATPPPRTTSGLITS